MMKAVNCVLPPDAKDLVGKPLLKRVMQTWLPAAEAVLEQYEHLIRQLLAANVVELLAGAHGLEHLLVGEDGLEHGHAALRLDLGQQVHQRLPGRDRVLPRVCLQRVLRLGQQQPVQQLAQPKQQPTISSGSLEGRPVEL